VRISAYKTFLSMVYVLSLSAFLYFLIDGHSYYLTPLVERPRHVDYWRLKPGGSAGLLYGIVGSALMMLMLLYSLRKRIFLLRSLGRLRLWLDFHIYCGIFGPLLVILHSSLKVRGLVALSFWSMVVAALSGIVGRYLYIQFPRKQSGDELSLTEVEELSKSLTQLLKSRFQLPEDVLERLDRIAVAWPRAEAGLAVTLLLLPVGGLILRWKLRRFAKTLRSLPRPILNDLSQTLRQRALLERRIYLWSQLHRLFHYWHVFHKPFSVVMYVFMLLHIAVALSTGYGWAPFR
jgi:hypothetical protein